MSVPNTNTFSLQDVVDVVDPTTDDLVDCFSDADSSAFNSSYNPNSAGNNNNLLNFRDYSPSTNVTMTLELENYLSSGSDTLSVTISGTTYSVTASTSTATHNITVPASTSISIQGTTSGMWQSIEIFDDYSLWEDDFGSPPYVSFNYTTPSSNFYLYAMAY